MAEMKTPMQARIGQEEETFPESRTIDQQMENSYEKIREIVPQIQHPNNQVFQRKQRMWKGRNYQQKHSA